MVKHHGLALRAEMVLWILRCPHTGTQTHWDTLRHRYWGTDTGTGGSESRIGQIASSALITSGETGEQDRNKHKKEFQVPNLDLMNSNTYSA